mmetsp:Transcript_146034/g.364145  ORF Transcript_146034/g.364145 Transcript_146034/m.364145 type:complete len:295 (+) Transcript_146034:1227-2111(+)
MAPIAVASATGGAMGTIARSRSVRSRPSLLQSTHRAQRASGCTLVRFAHQGVSPATSRRTSPSLAASMGSGQLTRCSNASKQSPPVMMKSPQRSRVWRRRLLLGRVQQRIAATEGKPLAFDSPTALASAFATRSTRVWTAAVGSVDARRRISTALRTPTNRRARKDTISRARSARRSAQRGTGLHLRSSSAGARSSCPQRSAALVARIFGRFGASGCSTWLSERLASQPSPCCPCVSASAAPPSERSSLFSPGISWSRSAKTRRASTASSAWTARTSKANCPVPSSRRSPPRML